MTLNLELTVESIEAARRQLSLPACDLAGLSFTRLALERLAAALRRLPCVIVMGEVNAGKTSVANRLISSSVLPAAVVANTAVPVRLHYATTMGVSLLGSDKRHPVNPLALDEVSDVDVQSIEVGLPETRLKAFDLIDTPAGGDLPALVDEADILIWCTTATRAWTESERRKVMSLPSRFHRSSVLVATHADALSDEDGARVLERLQDVAGELFSSIVLVNAAEDRVPALQVAGRASPQIAALQAKLDFLLARFSDHRAKVGGKLLRRLARMSIEALPEPQTEPGQSGSSRDCELAHAVLDRLADHSVRQRRVA